MVAWFDGVAFTVEIAFASDPLAVSPTWVDVSDRVRDIPLIFRGRTDEYGDFAPGSCTIVMDNSDRRFDPDYAAGPYYPNVTPMKRIRVAWAFAAASGVTFTGFVLGWPQQEVNPSDGFVTVTAVDGSRFAENMPLSSSAYTIAVEALTPEHYIKGPLPLQDYGSNSTGLQNLTAPTAVSGDGTPLGEPLYTGVSVRGSVPTDYARTVSFVGKLADTTDGITLTFYGNMDLSISVFDGQVWISYNDEADSGYTTPAGSSHIFRHSLSIGSAHHWAITVQSGVLYLLGDDQTVGTLTLSTDTPGLFADGNFSISTTGGAALSHVATWGTPKTTAQLLNLARIAETAHDDETSGVRIGRALDDAGWPSGLRDVDAGQPGQGPYVPNGQTLMEYARQVERSEQGLAFFDVDGRFRFVDRQTLWTSTSVATFSDDGNAGDLVYMDAVRGSHHDTIRNIVTASWRYGGITRRDATSIASYGEARESIDSTTIRDAGNASNLAAYVLRANKDPRVRISELVAPLRISGGDNEAETLLALEIGDKVTVERTPAGVGPQVIHTVIVQGIEHEIGLNQWTMTLYLSPAPAANTAAPYLTLGDATYGQIGATAGNLTPF